RDRLRQCLCRVGATRKEEICDVDAGRSKTGTRRPRQTLLSSDGKGPRRGSRGAARLQQLMAGDARHAGGHGMRFTSPPVATWLLESCGADEALIGDLVEQYARNRSRSWYWSETAVAMALCCCRTIV